MNTNRTLLVVLITLIVVWVSGCFYGGLRGNGNVISQERPGSGFNGIFVSGAARITIHIAENYRVTVTTDSNIQDFLVTKVVNDVLEITTKSHNGFNPTQLMIDVYMPEVTSISLSGAGEITIANGKTSDMSISLNGAGKIDAQKYEVQNMRIALSGAGEVTTWAESTLDYQLSGIGSIQFRGNPALSGKISGIGKVSPLGGRN